MYLHFDRIKIQYVRPEQRIRRNLHSHFREVRFVTVTDTEGVRVDYFDGGAERFPINKLVYVLNPYTASLNRPQDWLHGKHAAGAIHRRPSKYGMRVRSFYSRYEKWIADIQYRLASAIVLVVDWWEVVMSSSSARSWHGAVAHEQINPHTPSGWGPTKKNELSSNHNGETSAITYSKKTTGNAKNRAIGTKINIRA